MVSEITEHGLETALAARAAIEEKNAENTLLLDVRGRSTVTDYILLATGNSPPHLKALANEVQRVLKHDLALHCYRKAGTTEGGWLVLDYIDVIIHLLSAEARDYYAIEELWAAAPKIPPR